ncbi:hypothetical protein VTI74DRAFT_9185 [Chaetomium olivicolor]
MNLAKDAHIDAFALNIALGRLAVWQGKHDDPEFVQIISWNDYGESHYIGPLDDRQYEAFEIGKAPFSYVENMPHDGWRTHLPWLIDTYKGLNPAIVKESAVMWFRKSPGGSCQDGGTTGNTASQLQIEFPPKIIFDDKIFIAALLFKPGELWLRDAGEYGAHYAMPRHEWDYMPPNGFGIYRHSIPLNRVINNPEITRVGVSFQSYALQPRDFIELSTDVVPQNSYGLRLANWNAIVTAGESIENTMGAENPLPLSDQVCVKGFGATYFGDFDILLHVCTCTETGPLNIPPPITSPTSKSDNLDDAGLYSNDQKNMIRTEMSNAYDMAVAARDHLREGGYFDHFFSQILRNQLNFAADIQETYRRIADNKIQVMNFCPIFFNDPKLKFSGTVLNDCPNINLRNAHQTKAAVVVHETSHTYYAMRGGAPAVDVAYGYNGCSALPHAICPNQAGGEGFCHGDMSAQNADTYAHIAAGIYFTRQCKRTIPHLAAVTVAERADSGVAAVAATEKRRLVEPPHITQQNSSPAPARRPLHERRPTQIINGAAPSQSRQLPLMDDFIICDGSEEDLNSIGFLGYAHFGDSYPSGMGTGTTEGNKCRVDSNNYGDLVYRYIGDSSLPYERRSCSGDTTDGLYGQIDGWGNAPEVNVVTLTIGGNDLGFSTLVKECVISWGVFTTGGGLRERCLKAEDATRAHMTDLSDNELRARLKEAYVRILRKTGRRDTNLYVAGYPAFFNEETTDCNDSSFHRFLGARGQPSALCGHGAGI